MHASHKSFTRNRIRAASERGRNMANARWKQDRERRDALAQTDPAFTGLEIIRRVVVIDRETTVKEAVIYAIDSHRSVRRKLALVLASNDFRNTL